MGLDRELFVDWLRKGRHDCEVAQALLRAWTANLAGRGNDSLEDLFDQLLAEARSLAELVAQKRIMHNASFGYLVGELERELREQLDGPACLERMKTDQYSKEWDGNPTHLVDRIVRSWQDRRATPVVVDDDDDADCFSIPPESAPQSDSSGGVACGPLRRDASTQVSDWQSYSVQELNSKI